SLPTPVTLQLEKLSYSIAILSTRSVRVFLVPTAQEERGHLIGRQHLTERNRVVVDPDESSGRVTHNCFRLALSNSNADAVRKNTRDHCRPHPRQTFEMAAELLQIGLPHAGFTHIATDNILNVVNGST